MNPKLDTKSMIVGLTLGVAAFAVLGAAETAKDNQPIGRFQIAAGANNAYVVDTQTGQVWSKNEWVNTNQEETGQTVKTFFGRKLQ